jgi:hypothetical protein
MARALIDAFWALEDICSAQKRPRIPLLIPFTPTVAGKCRMDAPGMTCRPSRACPLRRSGREYLIEIFKIKNKKLTLNKRKRNYGKLKRMLFDNSKK